MPRESVYWSDTELTFVHVLFSHSVCSIGLLNVQTRMYFSLVICPPFSLSILYHLLPTPIRLVPEQFGSTQKKDIEKETKRIFSEIRLLKQGIAYDALRLYRRETEVTHSRTESRCK